MRSITHRQLRNDSAEVLRAVADGESLQVTNNGVLAAIIAPPAGDELARLVANGEARPPRIPQSALAGIVRSRSDRSTSDLIDESRGRW